MTPDKWIVLEILDTRTNSTNKRVFATTFGGYLSEDSWRISSPVINIQEFSSKYVFTTESGNEYECFKEAYGTSNYTSSILENLIPKEDSYYKLKILTEKEIF